MVKVKSATGRRPVASRPGPAARQTLAARPAMAAQPARPWARIAGIVVLSLLGLVTAFSIGAATAGPSASDRLLAEYEQQEKDRDKVQTGLLNDLAKGGQKRLAPVLAEMAAVLPLDATTPLRAPKADEVKGWREALTAEVARYKTPPSGGNGVNVTQIALSTSVRQFAAAADAFDLALTAPGLEKARLLRLAGEQRTLALRAWSAAAIQLDVINIAAGNGHVHADLSATSSDGVPEGTGAR